MISHPGRGGDCKWRGTSFEAEILIQCMSRRREDYLPYAGEHP